MGYSRWLLVAAAVCVAPQAGVLAAPASPSAAAPAANAEDARLTQFLDAEFAADLKLRPQLETRLGLKEGEDKLDDISDAAQLHRLETRRASVARMKAEFGRSKLSPKGQTNFDIWETELNRMELQYKYRRFQPPFYSFLYSAHSQLPDFMINTHTVSDAGDMRAYNARLREIPAVLDTGIAQTQLSDAQGIRAPRFEIERVIEGSKVIITGAPFDAGKDSPLWADAKKKVAKLVSGGKVSQADGDALLADTRASLLAMKPGYERVIAWATSELPTAPSGRVGAISLPGGEVRERAQAQHDARPHRRADSPDRARRAEADRGRAGRAGAQGRVQGPARLLRRPREALPAAAVDRPAARGLPQARQ